MTFSDAGGWRPGVWTDNGIVDIVRVDPAIPGDMISLLNGGDDALRAVRNAVTKSSIVYDPDTVRLQAPVPLPGKVLGIGLNYADHIEESGREAPEHQIWFNKQRECIVGPGAPILIPTVSDLVDYEVEMCFVIGKKCRHVPKSRAHEVIAGFCIGNDVSVRDWQLRTPTMTLGKSFDTHGPLGPWLVTPDELGDPHDLDIKCWVNGDLRQNSNTRHLIFDCYDQIELLTQVCTLQPGDVIFSGTPGGVGAARRPREFLQDGDLVRLEIDGLGVLENPVAKETAQVMIDA
ncbi:MAG: fumarylacetoacetate hydrolase family protein [Parvibaculaceae bacterium]